MRRLFLIAALALALLAPAALAQNTTTTSCYDSCRMTCAESGVDVEACTALCREQCQDADAPSAETARAITDVPTTAVVRPAAAAPEGCDARCRSNFAECTGAGIAYDDCMTRWGDCFERCFDIPDCRSRCRQAFSGCQRESPLAAAALDCRGFYKACESRCATAALPPQEPSCEHGCKMRVSSCYTSNMSADECDKKLRVCIADCSPAEPTPPITCEARCEEAYDPCVAANVSREDCKRKVLGCIESCTPRIKPLPPEPMPQDCPSRCKYGADMCVKEGNDPETCRAKYNSCAEACEPNAPPRDECAAHGCEISCTSRYYACAKSADAMETAEQREAVLAKCASGVASCLDGCMPSRGTGVAVSVSHAGVEVSAEGVEVDVSADTPREEEPPAEDAPRPGAMRRFWSWMFG